MGRLSPKSAPAQETDDRDVASDAMIAASAHSTNGITFRKRAGRKRALRRRSDDWTRTAEDRGPDDDDDGDARDQEEAGATKRTTLMVKERHRHSIPKLRPPMSLHVDSRTEERLKDTTTGRFVAHRETDEDRWKLRSGGGLILQFTATTATGGSSQAHDTSDEPIIDA
jgi:hypothetical protein